MAEHVRGLCENVFVDIYWSFGLLTLALIVHYQEVVLACNYGVIKCRQICWVGWRTLKFCRWAIIEVERVRLFLLVRFTPQHSRT